MNRLAVKTCVFSTARNCVFSVTVGGLKVVGVGREGLFCSACYVCHGCGLSNTCEPQEARANIDCVNAFLKRQSSGSSHLGDRLKRPL